MSTYKSCAQWPKGTIGTDGDVSKDDHGTREQAQGVCDLLCKNGFGGDGKVFPIRTWIEEPTPDITQHPLYRRHHGNMKGWRYITSGDSFKDGDERISEVEDDKWEVIPNYIIGCEWRKDLTCAYRRRISPESKPACKQCGKALSGLADESYCKCSECISKPERFVTLVVDGHKHDLESLAKSFGAIDIREGNALAALDGIEDRAIEAVRQAVKGGKV